MTETHPVLELDRQRRVLIVAADSVALAPLLSDSLCYIHTTGIEDTKATFLERVRTGELRYRRMETLDQEVRDYGSAVCVTGTMAIDVTSSGTDKRFDCRFVQQWEDLDGAWQLRYWQSTRL